MESSDQKVLPTQHSTASYQFSSEELRVLRECNAESFFQRSLPIASGLGLAAYIGVNKGVLKPSPRYGAVPKIVVCVIVGYFVGKFSYQKKCAEKIMQIPNSKLGEILRQRKNGLYSGNTVPLSTYAPSDPDVYNDEYIRSNIRKTPELDVDNKSSTLLDDFYRPIEKSTLALDKDIRVEPETKSTYDELRKQNRESYKTKQRMPPLESTDTSKSKYSDDNEANEIKPTYPTNKYGDSWSN